MGAWKEALYEQQNSVDDTDSDYIEPLTEHEKELERYNDLQQDVDSEEVEEHEGNWSEPDL